MMPWTYDTRGCGITFVCDVFCVEYARVFHHTRRFDFDGSTSTGARVVRGDARAIIAFERAWGGRAVIRRRDGWIRRARARERRARSVTTSTECYDTHGA